MKDFFSPIPKLLFVLALVSAAGHGLSAQSTGENAATETRPVPILQQLGGLSNPLPVGQQELAVTARFLADSDNANGQLQVTADLAPGWHIYSVTQQPGGPGPTTIEVQASGDVELAGPFEPDQSPKVRQTKIFKVPLEEHYQRVTWTAPIRFADGVDPTRLTISGRLDGQVCHDEGGCIPLDQLEPQFVAQFAGRTRPTRHAVAAADTTAGGEFRTPQGRAVVRGYIEPQVAKPGGTVRLVLTIVPNKDWHVYAYAAQDPKKISKPTLIVLTDSAGWSASAPVPSAAPVVEKTGLAAEPEMRYHKGPVSWTIELQVPPRVPLGQHKLSGLIGYQTCTESTCDVPIAARFSVNLPVAETDQAGKRPLAFAPARYKEAAQAAAQSRGERGIGSGQQGSSAPAGFDPGKLVVSEDERPMWTIIVFALLGGFILNFMPCVLPVIGLKIMAFVQQAGESRAKVFSLNIWYSLGMMSIFMLLATLAAAASLGLSDESLGWGEQFNYDGFNIPLTAVVFAMGLSFLGVWEIPIPGFVGGHTASELASKEGPLGAFSKGVITTILATPCSGPGLAAALAWVAGKPPHLVYLVFACMGLGMAFPYLVIGAFPKLIRFIPKPGAWMDTFKQIMGFVLLATVVYMFTFIHWVHFVPTIALLFGIWAACWWIGRASLTSDLLVRGRAWATAVAFAALVGWLAFADRVEVGNLTFYGLRGMMQHRFVASVDRELAARLDGQSPGGPENGQHLVPPLAGGPPTAGTHELPWEPFSLARLQQLTAQQKTVMVDFTADWCLTCKTLEQFVLNTKDVRQVVDKNQIVTLVADWTRKDPAIGGLLEALGSKQVPVLAIFPAGRPNEPIVLRGGYTKPKLIRKLEEAGPSHRAQNGDATAAEEPKAQGEDRRIRTGQRRAATGQALS